MTTYVACPVCGKPKHDTTGCPVSLAADELIGKSIEKPIKADGGKMADITALKNENE